MGILGRWHRQFSHFPIVFKFPVCESVCTDSLVVVIDAFCVDYIFIRMPLFARIARLIPTSFAHLACRLSSVGRVICVCHGGLESDISA
uniref:Uncharacterized protein n=1 Tax=Rhipicephalus zambeziensis TaxID=60191 RepID=A0A224YGC0_9ACAR